MLYVTEKYTLRTKRYRKIQKDTETYSLRTYVTERYFLLLLQSFHYSFGLEDSEQGREKKTYICVVSIIVNT